MIKNSTEYIKEYGRTNDIVLGIIMFWCITSVNKERYNLEYFNEKMDRLLDHQSTEEQMNRYKTEVTSSILDEGNSIETIKELIDIMVDIYGSVNLDYQLHMYGASMDGSGDWWLENREMMMNTMDKRGGMFSIIASSNGVSIVSADKLDYLDSNDWSELYKYYNRVHNLEKILKLPVVER